MKYQVAHYSLPGARPINQDRVMVVERHNAVLMVLADGLGGHTGGEIAAEMLCQHLLRLFQAVRQPLIDKPSAFLALGILQAHNAIVARGRLIGPPMSPRTTCVACLVQNGYAYWAHVGDSRLYHFRHAQLLARTQDHSTIEQLHQDGLLNEEEMVSHPQKNRLLKCLGGVQKPSITLGRETMVQRDDVLLLCTDGVWEAHPTDKLARYMQLDALEQAVEEMLLDAEKKMRAACDNISAICLRWEEEAPTTLPLQGNPAMQVDESMLRETVTQAGAAKKLKERAPRTDDVKAIEREIKELEDYLKRIEQR